MGAHIVRRRPPVIPPQPSERRQTTELTEHQIHELIRYHAHERFDQVNDDLEAELELIDALPAILPEATPENLPSLASPRLAHTLRRGMQSGGVPAPAERTDIPTIEVPEAQRSAVFAVAMPRTDGLARPATETPSTERPTVPAMPRPVLPALAPSEVEPRPVSVQQALPPIEVAPSEPLLIAGMPRRSVLVGAGRARLIVSIVLLLVALGAGALWLVR